jgi:hypothetical protein
MDDRAVSTVLSRAPASLSAPLVRVEVHSAPRNLSDLDFPLLRSWQKPRFLPAETKLMSEKAPQATFSNELGSGLPASFMVGLPETAVRESKERVRSALLTAGFSFPPGRITVNFSPADLPKEGGRFDLPIAVGILAASGQLPLRALARREFYGELALGGELRETSTPLPAGSNYLLSDTM